MIKKLLSIFLSCVLLPISTLAAEKEDVDFIQSEPEIVMNKDLEVDSRATIGVLYVVQGIGTALAIGTGIFVVGFATYKVGSWIGDCINSFIEKETADQYISKNRKGSIRSEFPGEYYDKNS